MKRILIVDDDSDVIDVARDMISSRHDVQGATSADQALDLVRKGGLWLLIVDIRMPDHRCIRLLEDVKTIDPNVAVLIVSDGRDASDPFAQDMLARYADGTLTKPFDARSLEEAIERLG